MVEPADLDRDDLRFFLAAARRRRSPARPRRSASSTRRSGGAFPCSNMRWARRAWSGGRMAQCSRHWAQACCRTSSRSNRRSAANSRWSMPASSLSGLGLPVGLRNLRGRALARFHRDCPEIELELLSGSQPIDLNKGEAELASGSARSSTGPARPQGWRGGPVALCVRRSICAVIPPRPIHTFSKARTTGPRQKARGCTGAHG